MPLTILEVIAIAVVSIQAFWALYLFRERDSTSQTHPQTLENIKRLEAELFPYLHPDDQWIPGSNPEGFIPMIAYSLEDPDVQVAIKGLTEIEKQIEKKRKRVKAAYPSLYKNWIKGTYGGNFTHFGKPEEAKVLLIEGCNKFFEERYGRLQ